MLITYDEFNTKIKAFENLRKAGIAFDLKFDNTWDYNTNAYKNEFMPANVNATTLAQLAALSRHYGFLVSEHQLMTKLNDNLRRNTLTKIKSNKLDPKFKNLKFIAQRFCSTSNFYNPATGSYLNVTVNAITTPTEILENGVNYRVLYDTNDSLFYVADTDDPLYNYLDDGFFLVYGGWSNRDRHKAKFFVTDSFGLDANYFAAAFTYAPESVSKHLVNNVFLPTRDARLTILKAEKSIPADFNTDYRSFKSHILSDFEANAQNLMVSKLSKNEVNNIVLHNIKISKTTATYETLSLEAKDLMEVVFKTVDANAPFDIYTMLAAYATHMDEQLTETGLNSTCTGFKSAKTMTITVNGFAVNASVETTNTRRKVNGFLINRDELVPVIRRAACHDNLEEFNKFVESVSKRSLETHNILSNGQPIKIHIYDYNDYGRDATARHPKLFFRWNDGSYYLILDDKKKRYIKIKRFVSFYRELQKINRQTNGNRVYTTEGSKMKDGDWCAGEVKRVIQEFAERLNKRDMAYVETKILTKFLEQAKVTQKEAEKRSEQLLESVIKETKAEAVNWSPPGGSGESEVSRQGYKVVGNMDEYFVDSTTLQVWRFKTGKYVCIVNGRGEQGVGKDGLIARLLALRNDSVITSKIGTLNQRG